MRHPVPGLQNGQVGGQFKDIGDAEVALCPTRTGQNGLGAGEVGRRTVSPSAAK
jgi:hypothetical protein